MLTLKNIRKSYQTKDFIQHALNGVSLSFRKNEFAAVLGASGSGKTTLLNIIGGLDRYDEGELLIEGVSTQKYKSSDWDTYRNNRVGFVFQSYNLIPHQSVLSNVELSLTLSGVSKNERQRRAIEALDAVGLKDHIHKLPTQLSGGQMQRVAIARSLINNPEIILADEPTGALDSQTGIQIMDILKEVAKDRLVIMVTHNPSLANKYANRIIELEDGKVIRDSNPHTEPETQNSRRKLRHAKMSFLTAVSLSISNLRTKKGRTFITALAGSIGIIGIASILALASGINLYINDIEQETMSAYPLTLDASGIDLSGFISSAESMRHISKDEDYLDNEVPVLNSLNTMFANQQQNDLGSLKTYIESNHDLIDPYTKNVQYKYGVTPQIYLESDDQKIQQVNPDSLIGRTGIGQPPAMGMISSDSDFGMKSFSELAGDMSLFQDQYDVVVGKWPEDKSELVVVLMENGAVSDFTLYALGLKDRNKLESMLDEFFNPGDQTEAADEDDDIVTYEQILGSTLKVINPAAKYAYDDIYEVFVDKSGDVAYMKQIIEDGLSLQVVGIIKSKDSVRTPMLSSGIYFHHDLIPYLIQNADDYDIVQAQLSNPDINVLTGNDFEDENAFDAKDIFNFEKLIKIDERMLRNAFKFDVPNVDMDFDIDIGDIDMPQLELSGLFESLGNQLNIPTEAIQDTFVELFEDFVNTQDNDDVSQWIINFRDYLQQQAVQDKIAASFESLDLGKQVSDIISNYFIQMLEQTIQDVFANLQTQMEAQIMQSMGGLAGSFRVDQNMIARAFNFSIDENEIVDLVKGLTTTDVNNQANNLRRFGYRDLDQPTQINIYPKDFNTKDDVIQFLDDYNHSMETSNQEAKVVKYTDFIGSLMSSVTTIINTISYALIAFVAISLIVSSIMIGVITYVSVLERIKEIGILRAIGASKKDIKRVFNAETLIIGFIAGTLGIAVTYVISMIASIIIYDKFNIPNIAHLEPREAGILIGISMVLAFISGLIPASSAANKDPVEALRTE
jgi:ABC-type lipoprotein export system ATPase subunit/ABC-type antimicrobial peptide transport system permease subunit